MKTDRIFVLLLVVMLPMSGCFDDSVGDAEAAEDGSETTVINNYYNQTNTPPVIYGDSITWWSGSWQELATYSMVLDIDGVVTNYGLDIDLDGVIDFEMSTDDDGNYSQWVKRVNATFTESDINPIIISGGENYCYLWVNNIAIDDDGAITIVPERWDWNYDQETEQCDF